MATKIQRKLKPQGGPARSRKSAQDEGEPRRRLLERKIPANLLTEFTLNLATLTDAGIPIVRSLTILEGQARPGPFKNILADIREEVESGTSMSDAMKKHPRAFDRLYSNMVKAGELGGALDQILLRLSEFMERTRYVKDKARAAMTYPIVVSIIALIVLLIVFTFVIPKFTTIFEAFEIELPEITQALIEVSDFVKVYWWIVILAIVIPIFSITLSMRYSRGFRRFIHRIVLKVPILGVLVEKLTIARFSRTFGTLISSGVPHLEALEVVRGSINNEVLRDAVEDVRESVREGEGIAEPLGESGVFDDMVVNMVDVGEETGTLDRMLLKTADAYESDADRRLEIFFKVLEPLLLVTMAVVVGFIVLALFLPLIEIMEQLGKR